MRTPSEDNEIQGKTAAAGETSQQGGVVAGDEWAAHLALLEGLAQLVQQEKLSELEIEQAGVKMTLRSITAAPMVMPQGMPAGVIPESYYADWQEEIEDEVTGGSTGAASSRKAGLVPVVAPMVGMFYHAQSPDDPPFVSVGDHIEAGHIIGLVEAMKTFNEIMSDVSGTVREIVAANGALVETGSPLILVEKG